MPKKYKNLVKEKRRSLFTQQQLKDITDVVNYIDNEIELQWETGSVEVDAKKTTFLVDVNDNPLSYTLDERNIMMSDLFERYTSEDWRFSTIFEDPADPKSPPLFTVLSPHI